MTTDDQVLAERVLNGDHVGAALKLMSVTDAVLASLANQCHAEICKQAGENLVVNLEVPDPLSQHTGFAFELDNIAPFTFCVEFDELRLTAPYIGLKLRNYSNTRRPYPEIRAAIEAQGVEPE